MVGRYTSGAGLHPGRLGSDCGDSGVLVARGGRRARCSSLCAGWVHCRPWNGTVCCLGGEGGREPRDYWDIGDERLRGCIRCHRGKEGGGAGGAGGAGGGGGGGRGGGGI